MRLKKKISEHHHTWQFQKLMGIHLKTLHKEELCIIFWCMGGRHVALILDNKMYIIICKKKWNFIIRKSVLHSFITCITALMWTQKWADRTFKEKVLFCNRNDKSILSFISVWPTVMYIRGSLIPLVHSLPSNWTDEFKHCGWHYMVSAALRGTLQSEWRCHANTSYSTLCHKATSCRSISGNLKSLHYGERKFWLWVIINIYKI